MVHTKSILHLKLESFIRKYYQNELLKGVLFFIGLGLLYLILTVFVEYFLWLQTSGRTILFWLFILFELFLLGRFVLFPIFKLFKFQNGISLETASEIIGAHFSEVGDKLTNYLQLTQQSNHSELLLASIAQKEQLLNPIPFVNAIDFKANKKYIPLALIPIILFLFFYTSGNNSLFYQPLQRLVQHQKEFRKPADFTFVIDSNPLQTRAGADFVLSIHTEGKVVPEKVSLVVGDQTFLMESDENGHFTHTFSNPDQTVGFYLEANRIKSVTYAISIQPVPTIESFQLKVLYPGYTHQKSKVFSGTGNALVPEGSKLFWTLHTKSTQEVLFFENKVKYPFSRSVDHFNYNKQVFDSFEYSLVTSNNSLKNYEHLNYHISVLKDQYPAISVQKAPDSLRLSKQYIIGKLSDDYGLHHLKVCYYPNDDKGNLKSYMLPVKADVVDQFVFSFPGSLPVEQGVSYSFYFEVFDNDLIHHYKSTRSEVFSSRISTESEIQQQMLQEQNSSMQQLSKTLQTQQKELKELDKLQQINKEKETLGYKDKQRISEFVKKQEQQQDLMKNFADKMKENLEKFQPNSTDPEKKSLENRLEQTKKDLDKNQRLLDEINKLNEQISKEELLEKMDQFKQSTTNQSKSLEQLLELTKKYYVEKKMEKIASDLDKLAKKQEEIADNQEDNKKENQEELNNEFNDIEKQLEDLQKQNESLKAPLELPKTDSEQKSIEKEQEQAKENLAKENKSQAKKNQKSAAKKMKEMSKGMQQQMEANEKEQLEEDTKAMRQILDNLLAFSFSQEDLLKQFKSSRRVTPGFNKMLKTQQDLRIQFKHIDDSIFAMSLRNPFIAETITKEIGDVHYNLDKSIETLTDANLLKGVSHQQFTISSANKLADFLADALNSMQNQMKMSGQGKGSPKKGKGQAGEMQLPDIIKKQGQLADKMKKGSKPGEKPGEQNPGQQPGQSNKPGGKGSNGKPSSTGEGADGEGQAQQIMQIYQEQQQLRESLQNELNKKGLGGAGQQALEEMKQLEKQLLNKGFSNEVLQKALNINYELLKLEKAVQEQGQDTKRKSETNNGQFSPNSTVLPAAIKDYMQSTEILNRQSLPLRPDLNQRVKVYFK